MMKYSSFLLILMLAAIRGIGQKADFLPKQNLWITQALDPIASQSFGRFDAVWESSTPADYALSSFAFGFQKSFVAWNFSEDIGFDIGIEGGVFTQFEWTKRTGELERYILSTDYLVGLPLVLRVKSWRIRLRLYHLSSHMGEDYIFNNRITEKEKTNNLYEQVDATVLYLYKNFSFYLGAGAVFRAIRHRKPLVFTGGVDYLLPLNPQASVGLFA